MNYHDRKHREWVLENILEVISRVDFNSGEFEDLADTFEINAYDELHAIIAELQEVTI